jgi:hypothetical protein
MYFPTFNPQSKVWIYTANRVLTESEQKFINDEMKIFTKSWVAHGSGLKADGVLEYNQFIILSVDESDIDASGCSIDSSVKFIKAIGKELSVDFFDRLNLVIEKDGEFKRSHISELKNFSDWNVFNPMITDLIGLRMDWKQSVAKSPFF